MAGDGRGEEGRRGQEEEGELGDWRSGREVALINVLFVKREECGLACNSSLSIDCNNPSSSGCKGGNQAFF